METFETLKYAELQQLAKQFGIKANLKADKLRAALSEYKKVQGSRLETNDSHSPTSQGDVANPSAEAFVKAESSSTAALEMPAIKQAETAEIRIEKLENVEQANNSFINEDVETSVMDSIMEHSMNSDPEVTLRRSITTRRSTFDMNEIKPMPEISSHIERQQVAAVKVSTISSLRKPKNWAAIHQRAFDKMDSLDVYVAKRQERQRYLKTPPKRAAALSNSLTVAQPKHAEAVSGLKPSVFKPSVLSTANINVNFSTMYKTPSASNASRLLDSTSTGLKSNNGKRLTKESRLLTPKETAANKSLLSMTVSSSKPVFDLKASLSKPLSYTPHKGKLKPFAHVDVKHITKAKSRDQRRAQMDSVRQMQRQALLASRRN